MIRDNRLGAGFAGWPADTPLVEYIVEYSHVEEELGQHPRVSCEDMPADQWFAYRPQCMVERDVCFVFSSLRLAR